MPPPRARKGEPKPPAKLIPLLAKPLTAAQLEADSIPWSLEPRLPPTFQQRGVVMETPASFGGFDNSAATQNTGIPDSSGQKRRRLKAPAGPDVAANFGAYPQQTFAIPWTNSTAAPGFNIQYSSGQNPYYPGGPTEPGIEATSGADEEQDLLAMWTNSSLELPAGVWGDPNAELTMGRHDLSEKARAAEFREIEETQK